MTTGGRSLIGALGVLVLWTAVRVIATETSGGTPYQGITERNVFGLKPPPPPPDPEANKPPPPKITLQGITTFGGIKRALFKVAMPAKPGEPAKGEQSFILAEGQRDGDIEVLEIDPKAPGSVKVNNFGTITNLTFENNGIKTASAAPPGAQPGAPGFVPPPAGNPFGAGGNPGMNPTRPMRVPPPGAAASSPSSYGGATRPTSYGSAPAQNTYSSVPTASAYGSTPGVVMSGGTAGNVALPGFTSAPTPTARQQNWPPETAMTPEEAAIQEAAYTMKNQDAIAKGLMPSIPGSNPLLDNGNQSPQPTKPTQPMLPLPPGAARPFTY
jgi:hypothetical protein